jgi:hypothetical protein
VILTGTRKLAFTAVLFAAAVGCVGLAIAANNVAPLFAGWIPLLAVAWVLARPSPGDPVRPLPEEAVPGSDRVESARRSSRRGSSHAGAHRPGRARRAEIAESAQPTGPEQTPDSHET